MVQSFWVGMVAEEIASSKVKAGDMVLYVGPHLCMIDKSRVRNAKEFSFSLAEVIKTAPAPRIMHLVRSKSINVAEDPAMQYTLGFTEGKEIASMIFNQGRWVDRSVGQRTVMKTLSRDSYTHTVYIPFHYTVSTPSQPNI